MNKKAWIGLLGMSMAVSLLTSCYDDKGNYDYISEDEAAKVVLGSLEGTTVKANEVLHITPDIKGDDNGKFSYLWYTLTDADYDVKRDTLSQERELNVPINLKEGKYYLYYKVTNEENGVFRSVSAPLTVTATDVTSGWYVMKEIEGGVDFDYHSLSGKSDKQNFLTASLGMSPLAGTPVGMLYQQGDYGNETVNPDGTTTKEDGLSALHVMTNKDYITLNASDFSLLKDLQSQFYEEPEKVNFTALYKHDFMGNGLVNNGDVHLMGSTIGKWGYKMAGDFKLYPHIVPGYTGIYGYDYKNNRMIGYDAFEGAFADLGDWSGVPNTELQDSSMTVIDVVPHVSSYSTDFYVVCKSGITGICYVSQYNFFDPYLMSVDYFEMPSSSLLMKATIMAAPEIASVIYFADGNKLYMHRIATGEDRLVKTFAEGENISFIKNVSGTEADESSFNDIVVITNATVGYNVYRFPLVGSAGELNTDVQPAMTGTGKASYLMFRQE